MLFRFRDFFDEIYHAKMKAKYNRPTVDDTNQRGYIPYPQDLKSHQAFDELEKRNQDKFDFNRELLEEKLEIPAKFKSDVVYTPDDLNKRKVLEDEYKDKVFDSNKK